MALTDDLAAAHETIARLEGEKAALADSVRTLAERVQKLEAFKRTLIASLQVPIVLILPVQQPIGCNVDCVCACACVCDSQAASCSLWVLFAIRSVQSSINLCRTFHAHRRERVVDVLCLAG